MQGLVEAMQGRAGDTAGDFKGLRGEDSVLRVERLALSVCLRAADA